MKYHLPIIAFIAFLTPLLAAEPEWSEPVNGVRARLSLERQKDSPFLKVFIELQNTSDTVGMKKLRFTPGTIQAQVTDKRGTPLQTANNSYDGRSPTWEPLQLPFEGTTRFRISFPGLGYQPDRDRTILDLGPRSSWIIPEDRTYFISGVLTITEKEGDRPHSDWSGILNLPKTPIPTN